jgi:hypothetical protein
VCVGKPGSFGMFFKQAALFDDRHRQVRDAKLLRDAKRRCFGACIVSK